MAESDNVTVRLGNTAPLMADGSVSDVGNTITDVSMRDGFDNLDEVELAASTANDPILNVILKVLDEDDRRYAIGVLEIQSLWTGVHSNDPPEWVESTDEAFAAVVAEYFTTPTHRCAVGRPDDYAMSDEIRTLLGENE